MWVYIIEFSNLPVALDFRAVRVLAISLASLPFKKKSQWNQTIFFQFSYLDSYTIITS